MGHHWPWCVGWSLSVPFRVGGLGGVGCCLSVGLGPNFAWVWCRSSSHAGRWGGGGVVSRGLLFNLLGVLQAVGAWQGTFTWLQISATTTKI